jgi:Zn-finger nucleic acid-binding protein
MKCPTDGSTLTMSERSGVEIDYCPECRGVWLDRGELDKILDRAAADVAPPAPPAPQRVAHRDDDRTFGYERPKDDRYRDDRYRDDRYRKPKKKEHWLLEILG